MLANGGKRKGLYGPRKKKPLGEKKTASQADSLLKEENDDWNPRCKDEIFVRGNNPKIHNGFLRGKKNKTQNRSKTTKFPRTTKRQTFWKQRPEKLQDREKEFPRGG